MGHRLAKAADKTAAAGVAVINSLWTFAALNVLTFVPLVWPKALSAAQFISSGWFQAVALPLLGISGERQARKLLRLLQDIHADVIWLRKQFGGSEG